MELQVFEQKIYSQAGEDGITMKLVELLYDTHANKYYVEFGVENGTECNTRILREKYGWAGLQMDGSNERLDINLQKEFITQENVVSLFQKYNVPAHINLLCVDIDFNDFYCLNKILEKYTCDVVIAEYNATHLPTEDKVVVYDATGMWDGSNYFGASLLALVNLMRKYKYTLIYCDKKGVNSFFIRDEIIATKKLEFQNMGDIARIYRPAGYGWGPRGGHPADAKGQPYVSSTEVLRD